MKIVKERRAGWVLYTFGAWTLVHNLNMSIYGTQVEIRHVCSTLDSSYARQGYDTGKYIRCNGCLSAAPQVVKFAYRTLKM